MPEVLTRVINLWSGPGGGKSTTKAGIFFNLKIAGYRVAQVEEYATERSAEKDWDMLANQRAVLAEQEARQRRWVGIADWIVTDSPLLLGCIYGKDEFATPQFHKEVFELYDAYENVNIWLDRPATPYQTYGRHHSEEEAREIDAQLLDLLGDRIHFRTHGDINTPQRVIQFLHRDYQFTRV